MFYHYIIFLIMMLRYSLDAIVINYFLQILGMMNYFYKLCIALPGIQTFSALKWIFSSCFSWSIVSLKLFALDWLWKKAVEMVNRLDMKSTTNIQWLLRHKYDRNYLNNCRFWLSRDAHQFRFQPRNLCGTNMSCLSFLFIRV